MVTLESVCAQTLSAPPTTSGRGNREMSRQLTAQLGVCSPGPLRREISRQPDQSGLLGASALVRNRPRLVCLQPRELCV